MRPPSTVPPSGELRLNQVVTTFGPGAMIDLPDASILVGGLESWRGTRRPIAEERLLTKLRELLEIQDLALYQPPIDDGYTTGPPTGLTGMLFPLWFLAAIDREYRTPDGRIYRTRPLLPYDRLVEGKYLNDDRRKVPVVPIRFVQACIRGHISDVDWYMFVREEPNDRLGQLWLDEGGSGNDFSEIFVRCERTGKRRALSKALLGATLGRCLGRQPWLGPRVQEPCDKINRLLTRSASNAYFTQTLSVISIPDEDAKVRAAVDEVWEDFLQYADNLGDVTRERKREKVRNALEGYSDATVWAEVERRKSKLLSPPRGIKQAEIETLLLQSQSDEDASIPDGDFYARARPLVGLPDRFRQRLSRIVLVHRLREVRALVGFTRFEASLPDVDGELDLGVQMAPLARETSWLPAVENRGEGVFLAFSRDAVDAWLARPAVAARGQLLDEGFETWKARKGVPRADFPGLPYLMLHSLSHLLITAVALECGYSASAIRERIYAGDSGYGILLYTGATGSEGTLGGLVEVGRNIEMHLTRALDLGRLCSNDPICAQHHPPRVEEERFLHGAACHGCLLIAETSCERRNELLDRALVVPTVETPDAAFFNS